MLTLLHNSVTCTSRPSLSWVGLYPSYILYVQSGVISSMRRSGETDLGHLLVFSRSLPIRSICLSTVLFVLYKHVAAATLINGRDLRLSQVPKRFAERGLQKFRGPHFGKKTFCAMNVCGLMLRTVARCVVCALGTPVSHARTDEPIDRNSRWEAWKEPFIRWRCTLAPPGKCSVRWIIPCVICDA